MGIPNSQGPSPFPRDRIHRSLSMSECLFLNKKSTSTVRLRCDHIVQIEFLSVNVNSEITLLIFDKWPTLQCKSVTFLATEVIDNIIRSILTKCHYNVRKWVYNQKILNTPNQISHKIPLFSNLNHHIHSPIPAPILILLILDLKANSANTLPP
jgi:hypothetical protein